MAEDKVLLDDCLHYIDQVCASPDDITKDNQEDHVRRVQKLSANDWEAYKVIRDRKLEAAHHEWLARQHS